MIKLTRNLASIDIESTGVDVEKDRIVELAAVIVTPGGERSSKSRRLNPGMPIPPVATEIHGITDDDLKDAPSFAQIASSLYAMLAGCDITGYNVRSFDVPMLSAEFQRCGITWPPPAALIVDAYEIFKRQEAHRLERALSFYCGRELGDAAHSAEADAEAALDVLLAQSLKYIGDERVMLEDMPALARDPDWIDREGKARWIGSIPVINFGKWSGIPLEQVEGDYFAWVLAKDFPEDFKDICRQARTGVFPVRQGALFTEDNS